MRFPSLHRDSGDGGRDGQRRNNRGGGPSRGRSPVPLPPGRPFRTLGLWLMILLLSLLGYQAYTGRFAAGQRVEISYTKFIQEVEAGNIGSLQMIENTVMGELKREATTRIQTHDITFRSFRTNILGDGSDLPDRVWAKNPGVEIDVRPPGFNWLSFVFTWLPFVLLIGVWMFVIRQMQTGGSAALKFGKSRAKVLIESNPKVTFKDVAGCDEAKQELQEIIEFLKEPQKFQRLGGRIPKGALLLGPPGTGKTLLARAVAGEAGVPFFSMSGSDFVEMFVGVGASVTGDTPVLVRHRGRTELLPIGEFVDRFYDGDAGGFVVPVPGTETLGFEERPSKFRGSSRTFVQGSAWKGVRGVYRHRVSEIYEIHHLGGVLRTTGDHSVFVWKGDAILPVPARGLRPGDRLVSLSSVTLAEPVGVVGAASSSVGHSAPSPIGTSGDWSHALEGSMPESGDQEDATVLRVVRKPFDGFVYDLCGCENEAFFGGEKPLLLHNSRVRDLFEQGKKNAPCIIFVDEIDAVGRHRGAGLGGGHDEREQTLNQLLVEMDGFDSNEGVILIAATNRPDVLDPALLRPGRFDRQIVVDWPDVRGREGILRVHTRNIPLEEDVDLTTLAKGTPGMAGADLANLVNEAALLAARRNHKKVSLLDFEDSKDKVMLGMERKSLMTTPDERKHTAFHEAGHALVAWLTPGSDPVHKVTIIPRGRALGLTYNLPQEERHTMSREECLQVLVRMMGGRAAERLVFGQLTTGAANDIEQATKLAHKMVCVWGMSDKLGPLTFGKHEEMVFLGREIATQKDYSEQTSILIDQEVRELVEGAYKQAYDLLGGNREKLDLLANTLLEREVLDGEELDRLLNGGQLEPPVPREPMSGAPAVGSMKPAESPSPMPPLQPSPRPAGA